MTPFD